MALGRVETQQWCSRSNRTQPKFWLRRRVVPRTGQKWYEGGLDLIVRVLKQSISVLVGVCGLGEALPRRGFLSRISDIPQLSTFPSLLWKLGWDFPPSLVLIWHAKVKLSRGIVSMDLCFGEGCCKGDSMKIQRSSLAPREMGLWKESSKASLNGMYNDNLEPKSIFDFRENLTYLQGLMSEWVITFWAEAGFMTLYIPLRPTVIHFLIILSCELLLQLNKSICWTLDPCAFLFLCLCLGFSNSWNVFSIYSMQHTRHHIGRWRSSVGEDASIMVKKSNIHFWEMDMWHITNHKFIECLLSITSVPRAVLVLGL